MDIQTKLYFFGGLSLTLAGAALYLYFVDNNKTTDQNLLAKIKGLIDSIEDHFKFSNVPKEKIGELLEKREVHVQMLQEIFESMVDENQLNHEAKDISFLQEVSLAKHQNLQAQLLNVDVLTHYLTQQINYLEIIFLDQVWISFKLTKIIQEVQQEWPENTKSFIELIFNLFYTILYELEQILTDPEKKSKLIQINYFINCILDHLQQVLSRNKSLAQLVAEALLLPVGTFRNNNYFMTHKCQDPFYSSKIENLDSNHDCQCQLFDLVLRYSSLITPTIQKRLLALLIEHQVFFTQQHLEQISTLVLKNSFYLASQISIDSMYYIAETSPLATLLRQGIIFKNIRSNLVNSIDNLLLYFERVITQNNPKFWSKILKGIISQHCQIYPMFRDQAVCQKIFQQEKQNATMLLHFYGVLLLLETRDTYDIQKNQADNTKMMDWMAENMDNLLAGEVISYLQEQFFREIIFNNSDNKALEEQIFKQFLQCLRVTQNKRIQNRNENKKKFEVNASLTKLTALIFCSFCPTIPTKMQIKQIASKFPFLDKKERVNIFTNIMRILFDLPSMNLHFLKYISPRCDQISEDAQASFNGYFTHILSAATISFDLYMFTLQIAFMIGQSSILLNEMKNRLLRDVNQFEQYKEFFLRDLILLVDILENPYYYFNVASFCKFNQLKDQNAQTEFYNHWYTYQKKAVISILQLNGELNYEFLLDTCKMFIHINQITKEIQEEILEKGAKPMTLRLKPSVIQNFPFLSLQKDMESVGLYIRNCEKLAEEGLECDIFDELLNQSSIPFLEDLRFKVFLNFNFQELIEQCVLSKDKVRKGGYVWVGKLIYYGRTVLKRYSESNCKKHSEERDSLEKLMYSDHVKAYISEISGLKQCSSLVKVLNA